MGAGVGSYIVIQLGDSGCMGGLVTMDDGVSMMIAVLTGSTCVFGL